MGGETGANNHEPSLIHLHDRIQFTAPDKTLGVANRDLAVIESIAHDGWVGARLDGIGPIFCQWSWRFGLMLTSSSEQG